ncbi:MAG: hypothetical protein ACXWJK_17330 [Burkholderiaceae bacterium]
MPSPSLNMPISPECRTAERTTITDFQALRITGDSNLLTPEESRNRLKSANPAAGTFAANLRETCVKVDEHAGYAAELKKMTLDKDKPIEEQNKDFNTYMDKQIEILGQHINYLDGELGQTPKNGPHDNETKKIIVAAKNVMKDRKKEFVAKKAAINATFTPLSGLDTNDPKAMMKHQEDMMNQQMMMQITMSQLQNFNQLVTAMTQATNDNVAAGCSAVVKGAEAVNALVKEGCAAMVSAVGQ